MSNLLKTLSILLAFSSICEAANGHKKATNTSKAHTTNKTHKTHRTHTTKTTQQDKKDSEVVKKRKEIKDKVHKRGYYLQSEMDYFLLTPNPMDLCSEANKHGKQRLKIGEKITERFGRPLSLGELDSTTMQNPSVTVETVIYTGKNFRNCLIEAYFLHFLTKIGKKTVPMLRCYMDRGSNTEKDPTKLYFVYPDSQKDLHSFLKESIAAKKTLSEKELANILLSMAKSLNDLHKMKIVHRNVSLQSFMINSKKEVTLGYFQHSRYIKYSGSGGRQQFEGQELYESEFLSYPNENEVNKKSGAPFYKSPEFIRNDEEGLPADVFALGVAMAALIGNKLPRDFMPKTDEEALKYEIPTMPEQYTKYQKLINSMMDRNFKKRPTAAVIISSLKEIGSEFYSANDTQTTQQENQTVGEQASEDEAQTGVGRKRLVRIVI
jgi:serine/threonine protein kinase